MAASAAGGGVGGASVVGVFVEGVVLVVPVGGPDREVFELVDVDAGPVEDVGLRVVGERDGVDDGERVPVEEVRARKPRTASLGVDSRTRFASRPW